MKKRFLAFLLAVCVAVSMLVLPASAVGSNAAVQTATALGGLTAEQAGSLGAPLTRGQAARLLTAFSAYRDTTTAQGRTGRLYSDVDSDSPYAVYIRTAVQNGWMTGYSDGSVVSSTWNTLTGKTDQLFSYVLRRTGDSVGGTLGDFLNYLGEGATYVCYSGGKQVAYSTATKYPIIAGGIAIGRSADGKTINRMLQLSPVVIDKLGAASVMSGDKRYETADDMQVYLWSNGQYFATSLPKINTEDYKLIGWYDNFGCSGGRKIRILVAVKTN